MDSTRMDEIGVRLANLAATDRGAIRKGKAAPVLATKGRDAMDGIPLPNAETEPPARPLDIDDDNDVLLRREIRVPQWFRRKVT